MLTFNKVSTMDKLIRCTFAFLAILLALFFPSKTYSVFYQLHNGLKDVYCTDHATRIGTVDSKLDCGQYCSSTTGCRGFFYNSAVKSCSLVKVISVPGTGCQAETGSSYYILPITGMFDCYYYTTADYASLQPGYSMCYSYMYNLWYSDMGASTQYGCVACECCKSIGCYTGPSQQYGGTWSRTTSGRTCQRWDQQTPHSHDRNTGTFAPGETYITAQNYCRDPDGGGSPWCYTTDPSVRWENCAIPSC